MMNTVDHDAWNWRRAARHGAGVGVRMTLFYATAFILYAVVRLLVELLALTSIDAATLAASIASLIVAALAITALVLPFSVLAASATSLLLYLLVPRVGARFSVAGTLVISMAVAFAVADTVQLVLLPALGFSPLDLPFATWIFWFGLPTLLYIIVVGVEGGRMRSASLTGEQRASATLRTPMQGRPG